MLDDLNNEPSAFASIMSDLTAAATDFVAAEPALAFSLTFLIGGLTILIGARLSFAAISIGAAILMAAHLGILQDYPPYLMPAVAGVFVLGVMQGVATLLVGEQQAGTILWIAFVAVLIFVSWRFPKALAGGIWSIAKAGEVSKHG